MNDITILHSKYDNPVKNIIHISDIHIRQGDIERSRYNEYKIVFNNFIHDIKNLCRNSNNDTIIIITGDVFHNKGKMDTPAIKLFFQWMDKMLNIAPVFIICGNHDFRQEDPHHPDMIEVLTVPYINKHNEHRVKHPLFYLKETGQYIWQNIGFGLVSVKDTLRVFNTAGIISKLPDFPSADNLQNVDFKIALFHGTLLPYNTNELKNIHGYRLEWFNGYNAVLLGDNHVQQIHHDKIINDSNTHDIIWGYPGSLIQQNFGEVPYGHGYILWSLDTQNKTISAKSKHILNNYGLITVKKQKSTDDYNVYMSKKDIFTITDAIKLDYFPQNPRIRVIGKTGEDDIIKNLFIQNGIQPESIMVTIPIDDKDENIYDDDESHENVQISIAQMTDINHTEKWIEFLNKYNDTNENNENDIDMIYSFINNPDTMKIEFENMNDLPKEISTKIKTRNTKIENALQEYKDIRMQHHGENHKIIFNHIYWDYVMCYGPGNYFDFKTLTGKVCLLNGRNAIGKSAFLDVLCIGLYGEPSKQRHMLTGKKMTGKMIHDHRPSNVTMSVHIMFSMNDETYEIFRSFSQQSKEENWARPISATICSVNLNDNTKTIVCEGTLMVDEWITKKFGTIDDILMSTFVSQIETNNFFHLKQEEQKTILDKALHLESISAFSSLLKESILAHNDITNMLNNSKLTLHDLIQSRKSNIKDPSKIKEKISKYTIQIKDLEQNINKLLILIGNHDDLINTSIDINNIKKQFEKNSKKLQNIEAITDEDKKQVLMIQGEQKAYYYTLRDEKNKLGDPTMQDISIQKIQDMIEDIKNDLKSHDSSKPLCNLSPEILQKQLNELNSWKLKQNQEWFEDPDALESILIEKTALHTKLTKKYNDCVQNPVQKPSYIQEFNKDMSEEFINSQSKWSIKDLDNLKIEYNNTKIKWNETITKLKIQPRSLSDYKKWNIGYKKWCDKIALVRDLDESLEDLRKRYNDYKGYVNTIESKIESQNIYKQSLSDINKELDELNITNLPYNPECWACKSLPTRKRYEQLNEKQDKITKDLQKIVKYLQKIPQFDLENEKLTLDELRILVETREYYENTHDQMDEEYNDWQCIHNEWTIWNETNETEKQLSNLIKDYEIKIAILENYLWKNWQIKENTLKNNCNETKEFISNAQQFINEYESYNDKLRFLENELKIHKEFQNWETKYNSLIEKQTAYELEYQRKLLDQKFTKWQNDNNLRIDLVDKIKNYELLEKELQNLKRIINYYDYTQLLSSKLELDNTLKQYSNELIRYEKEIEDLEKINDNMKLYELYYSILLKRKENLILLENRFIGEKNGEEGYKEWVYKQHVIPLIEKEINRFLSLIDTIRLKITYSNKSFQYMVIDRGNTPTLAMSSGYQRFIIGISLRLAFACIGATGQNIRHLFIDEGFVACDAFNLEKVQTMLHKMMEYGNYINIILMSHLEAIRDAADLSIDIHREGLFSRIQWGSTYPQLTKITQGINEIVKKKGRPKKVAN